MNSNGLFVCVVGTAEIKSKSYMYKDPSLQYLFEIINRHQHENTKFFTKKAKFCCYLKYFVLFSLLILKNYYMLLFFYVCMLAGTHKMNKTKTFPCLAST